MIGQTETLQSLSFDGPLAAWQGIVCGCILAAIAFWTLFGIRKDRALQAACYSLRFAGWGRRSPRLAVAWPGA